MNIDINRQSFFRICLALICSAIIILIFGYFAFPIILASIVALAIDPYVLKLQKMIQASSLLSRRLCVSFLIFSGLTILSLPLMFFAYNIFSFVNYISRNKIKDSPVFQSFLKVKENVSEYTEFWIKKVNSANFINLENITDNFMEGLEKGILTFSTNFLSNGPRFFLNLVVFLLILYLLLLKSKKIKSNFIELKLLTKSQSERLIFELRESAHSTLIASIVAGLVQSAILTIASLALSVGNPVLVFSITFLSSFVPIIGVAPIGIILMGLSYMQGGWNPTLWMFLAVLITSGTDNFVRAFLVSHSTGHIHPIIYFLSVIGAVGIFGISGLILGPFFVSAIYKVYRVVYNPTYSLYETTQFNEKPLRIRDI